MKLGMFLMPLTTPGVTLGEAMDEATRKALFLDSIGFDEFWLGEHFAATSEPIPSPLAFLSSLAPQTKRLVFGAGVIALPNRHPAVIAAEVAQIDHLMKGRFRFGIGTGGLPPDWELFGLPDEPTRKRMMLESIGMIQSIWRSDPPYTFDGEFWRFAVSKSVDRDLRMGEMPKPRHPQGPPVHVSISSPRSSTATLAGERGWGPLSSALTAPAGLAAHWELYARGLVASGRPVDGENWRVVRTILVAPSDAEATRRVFHAQSAVRFQFEYMHRVLTRSGMVAMLKSRPDIADADVGPMDALESRAIYGSPESVRDQLIALLHRAPFGHLLVSGLPWTGPNGEWERESLSLLAHDVLPALRQSGAARSHAAQ